MYNTLRLSFPSANNKSDKKDPTSPARTGDARCNFSIHLFTSNGLFGEESKPRYLEEKFSAVNVTTREGSGDTTCFRRFETILSFEWNVRRDYHIVSQGELDGGAELCKNEIFGVATKSLGWDGHFGLVRGYEANTTKRG